MAELYRLENGILIYPQGAEITPEVIHNAVYGVGVSGSMATGLTDYKAKMRMYLGDHDILHKPTDAQRTGPDNRLVANIANYLVDTYNGYFMGIPPKITLDNEQQNDLLQDWNDTNSVQDKLNEISKQCDIYGRSYALVYQDEDGYTCLTVIPPTDGVMIYDDTINHGRLAFIRHWSAQGDQGTQSMAEVYTADTITTYSDSRMIDERPNIYGVVPAVEFFDNEERLGLCDNVATLINELNDTLSSKQNQIEYFDNAYLSVLGLNLDADGDGLPDIDLQTQRMIYSPDADAVNAKIEFLAKPDADGMQEHQIDRLTNLIYQIAKVPNPNDDSFSGNASGVAMQYKMLSMQNMAASKERKFTRSLRKLYRAVFSLTNWPDAWRDLKFKFNRNLPNNLSEEVADAKNLEGVVSKETQLSVLSIVDDPKAEIDRMDKEDEQKMQTAINVVDMQRRQSVGGDDEDEQQGVLER
ncbi:phage portal protein [Ligilactobacillus ruminis]|uniref:phage portal protein n=1 Tax=Ligilactobacillus ruminis TaxID=1623 RepID=UPI000659919D|nr:phage portal protein [Ligilactobacillus ruminis]KLA45190.1 phage portal protein [Ligilactobacillus ruminis]